MTVHPIESYQQSVRDFEKAVANIKKLADIASRAASWTNVTVSNVPNDVKGDFPMGIPQLILDLNEWPDAKKVAEIYRDYYLAKRNVNLTWNALMPDQQGSLTPAEQQIHAIETKR